MFAPSHHRFYIVAKVTPKAKSEARCLDCTWAYFDYDENHLKKVFLYHYSEVHRPIDPRDRFTLGTFRTA